MAKAAADVGVEEPIASVEGVLLHRQLTGDPINRNRKKTYTGGVGVAVVGTMVAAPRHDGPEEVGRAKPCEQQLERGRALVRLVGKEAVVAGRVAKPAPEVVDHAEEERVERQGRPECEGNRGNRQGNVEGNLFFFFHKGDRE